MVVGGGINGCGIALEAARRGYRVLLLERGDIGAGTSSRSSRLIHGGLRYLRDGQVGLVRESSHERTWLRTHYPHLVRPLRFLIPFYRGEGQGPLLTRLGLWLYDLLSGYTNVEPHRILTAPQVVSSEPRLRREGLRGGAFYYDCWTDDFRLVLLNAKMAHEAGAHVLTYAPVEGLLRENGRVRGVLFRDLLQRGRHEVAADVVINATGAWSDGLRVMTGRSARLRPTKGAHVFLPKSRVGNENAVVIRHPRDGRFLFTLPWRALSLVGTTDTDYEGAPEAVRAESGDVAYLLEAVNHAFPAATVSPEDVISTYAALRPLVGRLGIPESEVSRGERVIWDAPGLLSLIGGKLTTYRRVAERVMRRAARELPPGRGSAATSSADSATPRILGAEEWASEEGKLLGLDAEVIDHLIAAYGPEVRDLYALLEKDAPLTQRILPDLPYLRGEVVYAVRHEMGVGLEDVLVRRTRIIYEDVDRGLGVAGDVARLMASELGWSASRVAGELEKYEAAAVASVAFRGVD